MMWRAEREGKFVNHCNMNMCPHHQSFETNHFLFYLFHRSDRPIPRLQFRNPFKKNKSQGSHKGQRPVKKTAKKSAAKKAAPKKVAAATKKTGAVRNRRMSTQRVVVSVDDNGDGDRIVESQTTR